MAPQHIDDLPRHEEPRQPMLGLIDDLPEERSRGARQLMMWGLGLAVVLVLFVVLVWVTAPTVGSGQNASGEAARIEQTATPLQLSDAQRQQIRQYFASKPGQRTQGANFSLAVGAAVPQDVPLEKLPPEILSALGGYQGNDYVLVGDQLVIVDSTARRVVALVPQIR
jgi:Protein of unknown function (DUF1236)